MPPDMHFDHLPSVIAPSSSPYGDGWDVLWLGHCGARFPNTALDAWAAESKNVPKGRVVHQNDRTVPEPRYLNILSDDDDPRVIYPAHTRITHHVMGSICSLAYGVSQAGARRILYEMGIKSFAKPFDIMLQQFCEGSNGHDYHTCITVQPQLFNHHRPAGRTSSYSDISDHGDEVREANSTENIQWSVRVNLEGLLRGKDQFEDQFPDGA